MGDLNRVNHNDVESISVIKDASAAAVYGARAAFGVILVTTLGKTHRQALLSVERQPAPAGDASQAAAPLPASMAPCTTSAAASMLARATATRMP